MNKYEQLIEFIINEQEDKARELFHQIVVEKSREIYENLIDETDFEEQESFDTLEDDIVADESGMVEADDELGAEIGDDMGGEMDAEMGDDMDAEMGDDMDAEMGGEEEGLEDRVMDLEAALDELKAEFDALMSDEMEEPEHADMEMPKEEGMDPSMVREYVDKVATPSNTEGQTVGAQSSSKPTMNTKSPVAGKNDMGGSTANIARGGAEQAADGKPTPKPNNQYSKGQGNLPHAGQFENVPGAKTKGYTNKAGASKPEGATTHGNMPVQKHSIVAK